MNGKTEISDLTLEELSERFKTGGYPAFRAKQVYKWVCLGQTDFDNMTDLPKDFRVKMNETYKYDKLSIHQKLSSREDDTIKYIFGTEDGNIIESVLMRYSFGNTACISTQAGCKMQCTFCASSKVPFGRNLTSGEMLQQITAIQTDTSGTVNNVVLMGIGEPLDNYDNVIKLIKMLHYEKGLNIGYRRITISTCGVVPGIEKLITEKMPVNLAVSLHSPYNEERSRMMPVNKSWPIDNLISVCNIYTKETMRRITFEYTLIEHINDTQQHALDLAKLVKGMLCHINLIPLNDVEGSGMEKSTRERAEKFRAVLESKGIEATIRRELGSDINAACGQLRRDIISAVKIARRGNLKFAAKTHQGMVRANNEDNYRTITGLEGVPQIFIIADGMGGHNAGEVASVVAVESVSEFLGDPGLWSNTANDTFDFIIEAMDKANNKVVSTAKKDDEMAGMGTTMIVSVLIDNKLYIGHVGDSRLYLIRDMEIRQITSDHSLVEALIKEGSITKADARNHPGRNIITRVIGTNENPNADTIAVDLKPDDVFLMCTDGLTNKLEDSEINEIIVENDDLNIACSKLIALANERGGEDNITVILISLKG